jgi:hypothetical protein
MAVRDQARVLYRLPEQRRFGASGLPAMVTLVLAAVILFLGGLVVGRASMNGSPQASSTGATTPPAATTAPPATAATGDGTAAASSASGATASRAVGPRRQVAEVGVGYAHSQDGAVAAAANFTRVLSSDLILDAARRRAAIDVLAAPEARGRLQKSFDQAVASLRQGLGVTGAAAKDTQVLLRATPVGWRVERFDNNRARVAIWVTSVGGSLGGTNGAVPVREAWGTTTVDLRWAGGDWKQVDSTTVDGPVPIADVAPPTATPELLGKANEFKEFTYAPGP